VDVPATDGRDKTVLMYGHMDKQPPLTQDWREGLHPYIPVIENGRLYGRGGADDGYAIFAALLSIKALEVAEIPHARCVIIIEASEESGSRDLPHYVQKLESRIGIPDLVVCLDSGCGNYEQFWVTTSLRGLVVGNLKVHILEEGAHSGSASGIVPSSFRLQRILLERLEDMNTGEIKIPELYTTITDDIVKNCDDCAKELGETIYSEFSFTGNSKPVTTNLQELLLNRAWRPQLEITGAEGLPSLRQGGNVLRSYTSLKLSLRIPPGVDGEKAAALVKDLLERDPPHDTVVNFEIEKGKSGWAAPKLHDWLFNSLQSHANYFFNRPIAFQGEGGSIPFMCMLGEKFPLAQFIVTGVLGPESNAHGPNEMLHIEQGKKVTCAVAGVLADHYNN